MTNHSSYESDDKSLRKTCFCDPWRKPIVSGEIDDYTDADLAADMNALSFEERQAMEADIHGVSDVIEETPEFVAEKIDQMREALAKLNSRQRQAWDRAVFLRPALSEDPRLHLMCLRARRFRPDDAAALLAAYFRSKLDLFGDELLIHRITWDDLTEQEKYIFRSGAHQLTPNHDRTGRGVAITRMSHYELTDNYKAMARSIWYVESAIEDDPAMQQKGVVTVADSGGTWKSSPLQLLHFIATYPMDATPFHDVSLHILYNDPTLYAMIKRLRQVLRKDYRMRIRLHFGSTLEAEYSLRTFGIDVSGQLSAHKEANPLLDYGGIEEDIRKRQRLDEEWRQSEAPYRNPSSQVALFPNPQDIIMGRNKVVALTWSGNIIYHKVIMQYVHRYIGLQSLSSDRIDKTLISVEILHLLRSQYNARFLARRTTMWVVIEDSEAQTKISQALRNLARDFINHKG